jgi:hypothetical protein
VAIKINLPVSRSLMRNSPFLLARENPTSTESGFLRMTITALERFFFSTVSVTVPLIEAFCACIVTAARINTRPAKNFLMVNG